MDDPGVRRICPDVAVDLMQACLIVRSAGNAAIIRTHFQGPGNRCSVFCTKFASEPSAGFRRLKLKGRRFTRQEFNLIFGEINTPAKCAACAMLAGLAVADDGDGGLTFGAITDRATEVSTLMFISHAFPQNMRWQTQPTLETRQVAVG